MTASSAPSRSNSRVLSVTSWPTKMTRRPRPRSFDLDSLAVGGLLQQLGGSLAGLRLNFVEKLTL
jgi:hypothetical protein